MAQRKHPQVASGVRRPNPEVRGVGSTRRSTPKGTGNSRAIDFASGETAKAEATRNMDYQTALAIAEAKDGDDSILLPYQPTPSINPPRPRTVAAGYDSRTRTLRVRFRDGVGYEYYDVPPRLWRNFKRVKSPGRFINRYFANGEYEYSRANW